MLCILFLLPNVSAMIIDETYLGSSPGRFNSIKISDIDKDGNQDLVFGNYEGYLNTIRWAGSEYRADKHIGPLGQRLWGIEIFDIDQDGNKEILAGDGDGTLRVFDSQNFEIRYEIKDLVRDVHGLAFGDADNDGQNEIVAGTGYKMDHPWGMIYLFSPINGELEYSFLPGNASRIRAIEIADIDGDTYNELVIGTGVSLGETPGEGYICIYQINGLNYTREWISEDLDGDVVSLEILDVDGDGKLEIVASNGYREGPGFAFIFRYSEMGGEGDPPIFEKVWESENIGPKPYGLDIDDIDSDGINEIVIGNRAGYIWIFDGSTNEVEWKSPLLGSDLLGITLGDVDGDGQIEIVAAQGGYQGKSDFTSAYTAPHIYILDGTKHVVEYALGGRDYTSWSLQIVIVILLIMLLFGVNFYISHKKKINIVKEGKSR
ncbi:MAG: hypothetical protein AM326_07570 [Candidatus Thorarchaeota archaeon SMTZ-45]|nr:MAG: hypothetical protein AM326_07570 [Candidatus Thorarchaeota archaeon SMTZ-45]